MNFKEIKIAVGMALAIGTVSSSAMAQPARGEDTWHPVTDDTSRQALFERFVTKQDHHAFAIPGSFRFPIHTRQNTDGSPRQNPAVFGIDISHWDGANFPFTKLAQQNVGFVYIKATQGVSGADPQFAHNWPAALGVRVRRGAYHFLSSNPRQSGRAQADAFVDYVNLHHGFLASDLPPAIDLEWDVACKTCADRWQTNHRTAEEIVQTTVDFVDRVHERTGRVPLLYTNKSFLDSVKVTKPEMVRRLTSHAMVWIFDTSKSDRTLERPDPASNLPFDLWQFTAGARLAPGSGFDGDLDADVFLGTAEEFERKFPSHAGG